MRTIGRSTCAIATALALLTVTAASAGAWADWEGSNRPQAIFTETIDDTFMDDFISEQCGAPIETHLEGSVRTRWSFNRGLGIQFDTHTWMLHGTFTNVETGQTVSFTENGSDRLAFEVLENGDYTGVVTIYASPHFKATVPGEGTVLSYGGGREVVYEVYNVIDQETFEWEFVSSEVLKAAHEPIEDWEAVCDALT